MILNFPDEFEPTNGQKIILGKIDKAIKQKKKFVIVSAPTGSGKSFIPKTLANASSSPAPEFVELIESYKAYECDEAGELVHKDTLNELPSFGCTALTVTKSLQDQYRSLFTDTETLKGKSNYQCAIDENCSVDIAPCVHASKLKASCCAKGICPYYNQRNATLISKFNSLNYSMFLALPEELRKRQFIVCDEASELEDELVSSFSFYVDMNMLTSLKLKVEIPNVKSTNADVIKWIKKLLTSVHDKKKDITTKIQNKKYKSSKQLEKLQTTARECSELERSVCRVLQSWAKCEYVKTIDINKDKIPFILLQPVYVDTLAQEMFNAADTVVLMSASIIDPKHFAKSLGIEDYVYVDVPSEFDSKKAPIVMVSKYKLSRKHIDTDLPKIAKVVQMLCDKHKDQKGLIHTHTFNITEYLRKNVLKSKRFLFRDDENTNEMIVDEHKNSPEPTILVSPSLTHGVDLKGDLAEFQIIVKAPYLPLGDERVKTIIKSNQRWYTNKMISTVVQAAGRGVRTKEDNCITYVLDGCITDTVRRNVSIFPKHFIDRIL